MKKTIFCLIALLGLLASCDPSKDDLSAPGADITADQLKAGFATVQYSDENYTTQQADGNYFTFTTSPSKVVTIYQLDADSTKSVLFSGGAAGKFKIVPKRGNPTEQTYYVETQSFDGTMVVAEETATVYVPTELTPAVRLLASDAYGKKIWKWDTDWRSDGGAWGNVGYAAGSGDTFSGSGNGIWFACAPGDLTTQLQHSDTGVATGEEDANAYMEFYDDGNLITYDGSGNKIRKGKYSVSNYTGERNIASADGSQASWSYGTLTTTEGSILFPFMINGSGTKVGEFEIMQLDADHLKLIYAHNTKGVSSSWGEATWWAFKSNSDPEADLTNYSTKDWTWDTDWRTDGGAWGNVGYAAGSGDTFSNSGNGIWFACAPADLATQLQHSDTGVATGEEDPNAYMTFDWKKGTVTSYSGAGAKLRQGNFEISKWNNGNRSFASVDGSQTAWSYGTLTTDAGSILFPFMINGGGTKVGDFEIMQIDSDHLKLIYPYNSKGASSSWGEATWWAFKAK